ncbi:MAG: LysM peptidoglycan-binding domain-containing protein [Anaerolineales bacterium]|nr:LysM peptidoglycan-binding domain-containing protein [Anaerolineales bacterium]
MVLFFLWSLLLVTQCAPPAGEPTPTVTFVLTATPVVGVDFVTVAAPTAVLLQTTPTPLPTPTVTPTATPIVHLVQEGETLLGIALANGTTVDEIMTVNPGMNRDFLQIGQAVVLPPPAAPLAQAVRGTAVPIQVTIKQVTMIQTAVGSVWLLGEVVNEGALPVEQVQVQLGLTDESGELIDSGVVWTAVSLIPPGEAAPFGLLVAEAPAELGRPTVSVVSGNTVVDLGSRSLDVVVVETAVTTNADRVRITGAVQNGGEQPVGSLLLTATFYDDQGMITGYQQQALAQTLQSRESAEFVLNAAPPGSQTTRVQIVVEAAYGSE